MKRLPIVTEGLGYWALNGWVFCSSNFKQLQWDPAQKRDAIHLLSICTTHGKPQSATPPRLVVEIVIAAGQESVQCKIQALHLEIINKKAQHAIRKQTNGTITERLRAHESWIVCYKTYKCLEWNLAEWRICWANESGHAQFPPSKASFICRNLFSYRITKQKTLVQMFPMHTNLKKFADPKLYEAWRESSGITTSHPIVV